MLNIFCNGKRALTLFVQSRPGFVCSDFCLALCSISFWESKTGNDLPYLLKSAAVQGKVSELPHIQATGAKHATHHENLQGCLRMNCKHVLSQIWREIAAVLFFLPLDMDFIFLKLFHSNVWDFYERLGLWFSWYSRSFQVGSAGSELPSEMRFLVWTLTEVT